MSALQPRTWIGGVRPPTTTRSVAASAATLAQPKTLFVPGRRLALLERPPAPRAAPPPPSPPSKPLDDDTLWRTGAFAAEVHPDLPGAASLGAWLKGLAGGASSLSHLRDPPLDALTGDPSPPVHAATSTKPWVVRTVSAQTRSLAGVEARLAAAAAGVPGRSPPADAILVVSGGDPARRLPGVLGGARTDAVAVLRAAARMREAGDLDPGLALWAVANPLAEADAGRAASKVEAGASALLTQPPLGLWSAWEAWYADAEARGVTAAASLVAGLATPTTGAGFAFWLALSGAAGLPGARAEASRLGAAASAGRGFEAALETARSDLKRFSGLAGLAGVHAMPVSAGGRRVVAALVAGGDMEEWGGGGVRRAAAAA